MLWKSLTQVFIQLYLLLRIRYFWEKAWPRRRPLPRLLLLRAQVSRSIISFLLGDCCAWVEWFYLESLLGASPRRLAYTWVSEPSCVLGCVQWAAGVRDRFIGPCVLKPSICRLDTVFVFVEMAFEAHLGHSSGLVSNFDCDINFTSDRSLGLNWLWHLKPCFLESRWVLSR